MTEFLEELERGVGSAVRKGHSTKIVSVSIEQVKSISATWMPRLVALPGFSQLKRIQSRSGLPANKIWVVVRTLGYD